MFGLEVSIFLVVDVTQMIKIIHAFHRLTCHEAILCMFINLEWNNPYKVDRLLKKRA